MLTTLVVFAFVDPWFLRSEPDWRKSGSLSGANGIRDVASTVTRATLRERCDDRKAPAQLDPLLQIPAYHILVEATFAGRWLFGRLHIDRWLCRPSRQGEFQKFCRLRGRYLRRFLYITQWRKRVDQARLKTASVAVRQLDTRLLDVFNRNGNWIPCGRIHAQSRSALSRRRVIVSVCFRLGTVHARLSFECVWVSDCGEIHGRRGCPHSALGGADPRLITAR